VAPNQVPRLPEHDAWASDPSLRFWYRHFAAEVPAHPHDAEARLHAVGRDVGGWRLQDLADRANRITPELATWDRTGTRIDDVRFDSSWHELLGAMTASGVTGMPWTDAPGGYLLRAAALEQWARLDIGALCPVSMTTAAVSVLRPLLGADDELVRDLCAGRAGQALAGMAMTEPQGGSDLSMSTTRASVREDGSIRLDGHKWFVSHAVADALLVLARDPAADDRLSCFLVRAQRADGSRNGIQLQRLKDKLGTRSLASAEAVLHDCDATRLGEAGAGVRTIIEMVVHTRMDCSIGSCGVMSRAVQEAVHHATHRTAFGEPLVEQPLMRAVLADLMLEREGAAALMMEVARSFETADPLRRLVPAVAKYWITRRAVAVAIEACEALGGNGYTEEYVLARLYRDAQVNSTWEGSGNVIVLDVFRALHAHPELLELLRARVETLVAGDRTGLGAALYATIPGLPNSEAEGRRFVGRMACALQGALLVHRANVTGDEGDAAIAAAFGRARVDTTGPRAFGESGTGLLDAAPALLTRLHPMTALTVVPV
jgi:putative acyl-CoA dehydrogenase